MIKIEKTKDYKKFKFMKGNRGILDRKVNSLMESIQNNNLMDVNPIIVNDKFYIIDGQHRFNALKNLGLEITYIQKDNLTLKEIQLLNSQTSNWAMNDFINSYCEIRNKNYIRFKEFSEKYNLTLREMLALFGRTDGDSMLRPIKNGSLIFDEEKIKTMVDIAEKYYEIRKFFNWHHSFLVRAFVKIVKSPKYDHKRMIEKMNSVPNSYFIKGGDRKTMIRVFEDIYNYHMRESKNTVRFF